MKVQVPWLTSFPCLALLVGGGEASKSSKKGAVLTKNLRVRISGPDFALRVLPFKITFSRALEIGLGGWEIEKISYLHPSVKPSFTGHSLVQ